MRENENIIVDENKTEDDYTRENENPRDKKIREDEKHKKG
jgi:hypothetical protein